MSVTYADISSRIYYELGEPIHITFKPEELFAYAVEGARLLHRILTTIAPQRLLVASSSLALAEDGYQLTLPTGCQTIYDVIISDGTNKWYLEPTDLRTISLGHNQTGSPIKWTRFGSSYLWVAPKADGDYTATIYYVPNYTAPTTTSGDLGVPDIFRDFIVDYVVVRARNRDDRMTITEQNFLNLKLDTIKAMVAQESEHTYIRGTLFYDPYTSQDW